MIALGAHRIDFSGPALGRRTLRVTTDSQRPAALRHREAFMVSSGSVPEGFALYLVPDGAETAAISPISATAQIPAQLRYLSDGDVIRIVPGKGSIRVLFRRSSPSNSFLLTERCNNYCLMCSQPPRKVQDGWIVDEILEALPLIDPDTREIGFTGGEPTLLDDRFLELVQAARSYLPRTALHVLSNGRTFADAAFAKRLSEIAHPDLMIGIPVYSDLSHIHDYVVQADGAFDETIRGIMNLKQFGVPVEIRVVLHKQTIPRLAALASFLTRNLLFVDHVALMGLEMMGFTKANLDDLWIDPAAYQAELTAAVETLDRARMNVSIYNSQLCLMDPKIWRFTKRSISDWKQEYMPECEGCGVMDQCAGFFASAKIRYSDYITPVHDRPEIARQPSVLTPSHA
jgi:His-Xaa-Ser system radical SAM maturase HxsC